MKVLITGSSRGIGHSLVLHALAKGHEVLAVARDTSTLQKVKEESGGKLTLLAANVSTPDGLKTVVEAVKKQGALDILVNNAGVLVKGETPAEFQESFNVNALTPFYLAKALIPVLEKSKEPRVIQISTMMASITDNTSGGAHAYRSSKAALNMLTKGLTIENPKIAFQLIHPGWVKTDMGGEGAPTEISESVEGIWKVIETTGLKNTGAFRNFRGETLPW